MANASSIQNNLDLRLHNVKNYFCSIKTLKSFEVLLFSILFSISISDYITMGQGTSRLNWECSCEDGKFNLSATYEEQKFSPTETIGKILIQFFPDG
jgi:hypothetical protein